MLELFGVARIAKESPAQVSSAHVSLVQGSPTQICSTQEGSIQDGPVQVGPTQVGLTQVGTAQVSFAQVSLTQIGPVQICPAQVGSAQVGAVQIGVGEIGPAQVGFADAGLAQVGPAQVAIQQGDSTYIVLADIHLCRLSSFLEQTHSVSSPHCGVRMSCSLLRWHPHSTPFHPSCSHCLFTLRDDSMGSPPLSRRSEEGFDRRQEHIQFKWFPEGDKLALL